jgi:hypothetical protein
MVNSSGSNLKFPSGPTDTVSSACGVGVSVAVAVGESVAVAVGESVGVGESVAVAVSVVVASVGVAVSVAVGESVIVSVPPPPLQPATATVPSGAMPRRKLRLFTRRPRPGRVKPLTRFRGGLADACQTMPVSFIL